jgi:hypothetical protein
MAERCNRRAGHAPRNTDLLFEITANAITDASGRPEYALVATGLMEAKTAEERAFYVQGENETFNGRRSGVREQRSTTTLFLASPLLLSIRRQYAPGLV